MGDRGEPSDSDGQGRGASWQQDPFGRHEERWWDGAAWTDKVRDGRSAGIDPPGIVAAPERHGVAGNPAAPITDAKGPVRYAPAHLPRVLLLGVLLLTAIVVLILVGIATA